MSDLRQRDSIYGGISGFQWRTIPVTWDMTAGPYLIAIMGTGSASSGLGAIGVYGGGGANAISAYLGGSNFSRYFADGIYSVVTTAFPASVHLSAINQTGSASPPGNPLFQPYFRLIGTGP